LNNTAYNAVDDREEGINKWDNGYPNGGNYFDDYGGVDVYHGPNQNIPGPDGMGDTAYGVGFWNNVPAYYPFINESGWLENIPEYTVWVDDDYNASIPGWGYDHFDKIQDGIDAVLENGIVYVFNGTYYENVIVNKTIKLNGENKNTTIIDDCGSFSDKPALPVTIPFLMIFSEIVLSQE